ncbi:MAG TPA: serine/threonine-protein kinase, partial [Oribacterium sp.]|nr:serine/threonine-protein kinase [Oribacterium sp.]
DIKPQNIIVDSEGNVKVADFGIARAATQQTVNATVMGSVHYISPEQARSGQSDERSDIYSFGCTLYEMLTGQVPYDGDTSVSVVFAHLENPVPHVKDLVPDVYPALDMAVYKCMQKKPKLRYQHIGELMEDLRRALKDPSGSFMAGEMPEDLSETRVLSPRELALLKHRQELRQKVAGLEAGEEDEEANEGPGFHMTKLYRLIAAVCVLLIVVLVVIIGRNMLSFLRESKTALETTQATEESSTVT